MYGKKDESHIQRFRNSTTEKFCCMNSLYYAAPEDQKLALDWLEERLGLRQMIFCVGFISIET